MLRATGTDKRRFLAPLFQDPLNEGDFMKYLLDKSSTLDTMTITKMLSQRGTNALGDFEVNYTYDPPAVHIVDK